MEGDSGGDDQPPVSSTTSELTRTFAAGSMIIPLDTTFQNTGALRAYGLVYRLLSSGIPVHWAILTGKPDGGNDFTIGTPATVRNLEGNGVVGVPVSYRGGPFIIDAADRTAALPLVTAWLASDTVTVVHTLATGTFTADISRTLNAAARIAVLQDGNEAIAIADFNAAGIPDSAGVAWTTASGDILPEATIAGPTTTSHVDGALWNSDGTPKYCNLTSMHYNPSASTPEVAAEVRGWLNAQPGNHAFMECRATATFENATGGRYLTTGGIVDDNPATNNPPTPLVNRFPDDPLMQIDGGFDADTGTVDSIALATGSTFATGVRALLNEQGQPVTTRIIWLSGRLDGNNANGKITYLAGHDYSVATPLSTNPQTNGAKLLLNSLLESGCATPAGGQPNVTLTKAGPATTNGSQITYTITYANTGTGVANNATITDAIPAGTTFVSANNGGTFAAGTVTWTIGNIAPGATASVTLTVGVTADGSYTNRATIQFKIGVTTKTVTSNPATTIRDVGPPDTTITVKPSNPSDVRSPTFDFTSTTPGSTFECSLDGAAFTPCTNLVTVGPLALGNHTFRVQAKDPAGRVDPSPASYAWRVNDTPVAANDAATTAEDTPRTIAVLGNDTGLGDTPVSFTVTDPPHGTAVISGNTVVYTPDPDYNGPDAFTYTITDGDGQTSTATVNITVTPVNDTPSAAADTTTTAEDTPATIAVLGNDTGLGDAPVSISLTDPPHGTVTLVGTTVLYTPDPDYNGPDAFSYTITDADGQTSTATVNVTVNAVNDTPGAAADTAITEEDTPVTIAVLGNDTGLGDAPVTITATTPMHGTVTITGNTVVYTPDPDYNGSDVFTYTITDADGQTSTATVDLLVTSVDDVPNAVADAATTAEDTPVMIAVLGNDTGLGDAPVAITATDPPHGTITMMGGMIIYTPDPDYNGPDTFSYTVSDEDGQTSTTTVTVTVTPVNDAPVAVADDAHTDTLPIDITVLGNDRDPDGDPLTVTAVTKPAHGSVTINADGTLHYTPDAGYMGSDTFSYTVDDGHGGTSTVTVTVMVQGGGTPGDMDDDRVPDGVDNCPTTANSQQEDQDGDGIGDACDPDKDGDGFVDTVGVSGGGCQTGGGSLGLGAIAALALLRRRRQAAIAVAAVTMIAGGALTRPAAAQAMEPANFGVERFRLSSDRDGMFDVEWAEVRGNMAVNAALWAGFANDPLVAYQGRPDDRAGSLVADRAGGSLSVSISPKRWLQLGFDLPLVIYQDRPATAAIAPMGLESLHSFGTSNLRVSPKIALLHQAGRGVSLAVIPAVILPTRSTSDAYFDDRGFGFAPELALSRRWTGWRAGIDAGYRARKRATFLNQVVDDELFAHAGVGYQFADRGGPPLGIDVTMSGATAARAPFSNFNENHLETLVGATYDVNQDAQLFGGAGAGLRKGFGTPDWRGLVGLRLGFGGNNPPPARQPELDRDGDGLLDLADKCPMQAEDKDSFEDDDGCPDPDNDRDGTLDVDDRCVNVPGIADLRGCPDTDADGLADLDDKCPTEPEDMDGFEDGDGCPELDNDKDGTLDREDACPLDAGPVANKGCPDPDRDGDTVVDRLDNCPDEKGLPEHAGCPKKQLVTIGDDRLDIIESVYFKTDRAVIEPRSFALLDNVVAVLVAHDTLKIQVEGHTDSEGNDAYNKNLSQRRAEAVVAYLVKKGVAKARLTAVGYGEERPIADNKTKEGRAQNRRVVFTVLDANGKVKTRVQGAGDDTK